MSEAEATEDASSAPSPRRTRVSALSSLGPSTQAAVPAAYAWAVTVAPFAWAKGASLPPKLLAVAALLALGAGVVVELLEGSAAPPRASSAWRTVSAWVFVVACGAVWAIAASPLGPATGARLDTATGALGTIGWGLFAFSLAGPSLRRSDHETSAAALAAPAATGRAGRLDLAYLVVGVVAAGGLQLLGWDVASGPRAALVRLVAVVCGIAVLACATNLAMARHLPRRAAPVRVRFRRALPAVSFLVLALGTGAALVALGMRP